MKYFFMGLSDQKKSAEMSFIENSDFKSRES